MSGAPEYDLGVVPVSEDEGEVDFALLVADCENVARVEARHRLKKQMCVYSCSSCSIC